MGWIDGDGKSVGAKACDRADNITHNQNNSPNGHSLSAPAAVLGASFCGCLHNIYIHSLLRMNK